MDAQVAIVGAGPAGALLSYLLSSRGIDTLLLERQTDFSREFRGEFLMPSGIRALHAAGFDLDSISTAQIDRLEAFMNGRQVVGVDVRGFEPPRPAAVSQPELLERLVEMSAATGHFELRRGVVVREVERNDGGGMKLRVRGDGGSDAFDVPFVVGADGRGSASRRCLATRVEETNAPLDVVWFKMAYPEAWVPQVRIAAGRGQFLIAGHSADGLLQIGWVILKGTYGELKSRSIEEWIDELREQSDPELAAHLEAKRETVTRPFLLNAAADRVVGWATPGALLIGDAAHTMSPVGGQGVNIALRDAIVAANELVPAFHKGAGVDEAAARVEAVRGPEVDQIQRMQAIPPRISMGRTVFHAAFRAILARVLSSERARSRIGGRGSVFLNGVTDVELRV